MPGFQSPATRDSPGNTPFSICKRFALASAVNCAPPVRFPTGAREARDQTGVERINGVRVDDRDSLGGILDGKGRGRRDDDDYVDIQSNHLRRKLFEALSLASCIPALDNEVATLLVPVFPKPLEQGVVKAFMSVGDKSHAPNFGCVLRERTERQGSNPAAHEGYEVTSSHGRPLVWPHLSPDENVSKRSAAACKFTLNNGWDVRFGSKADICSAKRYRCFSPESGQTPSPPVFLLVFPESPNWYKNPASAFGVPRTIEPCPDHVRFTYTTDISAQTTAQLISCGEVQ